MSAKFVDINSVYRIRSSIALVQSNNQLEMFKTNTRESLVIEITYKNIIDVLLQFDGKKTIEFILNSNKNLDKCEFFELIEFLNLNRILIKVDQKYSEELIINYYRLVNFLEDYCANTSHVISKIENIYNKKVVIVGLGAVGTWIASSLARSGVKNFILIDDDTVELSNLHRQDMYFEDDVGMLKIDCAKRELQKNYSVNVETYAHKLDSDFLLKNVIVPDLFINCADFPNVDTTSNLIGAYCMENEIPHLIGGGYNLHLTLIGQTVIPGKTSCIKCFESALNKINEADLLGVKKLNRPNRKIGSFGPLCCISAAIGSIEATKILFELNDYLINTNKRIEFRVNEQDFFTRVIEKNKNCEWCGENGKFN